MSINPIIVLVTAGKHERVDYAKIIHFDTLSEAQDFVDVSCTGKQKHWQIAQIVNVGAFVELCPPEEDM
jgi:hypothetical protein